MPKIRDLIALQKVAEIERYIRSTNPVLYLPLWKRDGDSFVSDDAYAHLATAAGALWKPQGRQFDGLDDNINMGTNSLFNFTTSNFTVELWFNPFALGRYTVVCRGAWKVDGWYIFLENNGLINFATNQAAVVQDTNSANGIWTTGTFLHIVIIRNGTLGSIFRNGVNVTSVQPVLINPLTSARNLYTGRDDSSTLLAKGTIGEVLIYSRALTPVEIQQNYLATKWRYI